MVTNRTTTLPFVPNSLLTSTSVLVTSSVTRNGLNAAGKLNTPYGSSLAWIVTIASVSPKPLSLPPPITDVKAMVTTSANSGSYKFCQLNVTIF